MITKQNSAGNKQRSYKIMEVQMFATSEKVKPDTENKRFKLGGDKAYDRSVD
jgi:hypothetical protein